MKLAADTAGEVTAGGGVTGGDLHSLLDRLEARFADREPALQAFVPEDGRFERLRREAEALLARWPDPEPARRSSAFRSASRTSSTWTASRPAPAAACRPRSCADPRRSSVTPLKEAGALVLGKTVSTEFAYFAPGPTRNPHHPEHTPGGSSSGSAAAVAAGLCPLALGTQTIGSIIRPAAYCGVVGFKPSYGRISADGRDPARPLARPRRASSLRTSNGAAVAARPAVHGLACRRLRAAGSSWGSPKAPTSDRPSEEGRAHFHASCERLAQAGYEIWSMPAMPDFEEIETRHSPSGRGRGGAGP